MRVLCAMVSHSPTDRFHGNTDVQLGKKKISLKESMRRQCSCVTLHWSIRQDSWFPENQLSADFLLNRVALKLLADT